MQSAWELRDLTMQNGSLVTQYHLSLYAIITGSANYPGPVNPKEVGRTFPRVLIYKKKKKNNFLYRNESMRNDRKIKSRCLQQGIGPAGQDLNTRVRERNLIFGELQAQGPEQGRGRKAGPPEQGRACGGAPSSD